MLQTHTSVDLVAACAGFPYGLLDAVRILQEVRRPILLVCAEKFSDKVVFGDGAAALVVAPAPDARAPDHARPARRPTVTLARPGACRVRPRRARGCHAPSPRRPLTLVWVGPPSARERSKHLTIPAGVESAHVAQGGRAVRPRPAQQSPPDRLPGSSEAAAPLAFRCRSAVRQRLKRARRARRARVRRRSALRTVTGL